MQNNRFNKLQSSLRIKFKDLKLLEQAFIHRSYLNEFKVDLPSNERLEFLGDSILSLVVSRHLFEARREDTEGDLTNLRAYIVKTKSLAQAAKNLNLGGYLQLSRGEAASGGQNNPQLLANTYEALLGAIYLDLGLEEVKEVTKKTLLSLFTSELKKGPPQDAKSRLQETVQEKIKTSPYYKILQTKGPDHAKQFMVAVYVGGKEYGKGIGNSKQVAEEQAAREALKKMTK